MSPFDERQPKLLFQPESTIFLINLLNLKPNFLYLTYLYEDKSLWYLPWKLIISMKCIYFDACLDTAGIHNWKKKKSYCALGLRVLVRAVSSMPASSSGHQMAAPSRSEKAAWYLEGAPGRQSWADLQLQSEGPGFAATPLPAAQPCLFGLIPDPWFLFPGCGSGSSPPCLLMSLFRWQELTLASSWNSIPCLSD